MTVISKPCVGPVPRARATSGRASGSLNPPLRAPLLDSAIGSGATRLSASAAQPRARTERPDAVTESSVPRGLWLTGPTVMMRRDRLYTSPARS